MATLTWHGHSAFTLVTDTEHRIMFDPFLDENPSADMGVDDVEDLDFILVSHGHFDHFTDAVPLAKKTGATLLSTVEIIGFAEEQGVEHVHPLNIGGGNHFAFGYARMTPALHGGKVAGDESGTHTTFPGGWWLDMIGGKRLYHAGDTALLTDMQLLKDRVDVALLPIGDNFTMGPDEAARAVDFIEPDVVIPIHYDTWELIAQDPKEFAAAVGDAAEVVILQPGGNYEF